MTPAARHQAAIEILDRIIEGEPAERCLTNWARSNRFAGSGDRHAIRDIVYEVVRRKRSCAALGGGMGGRALVLGLLRQGDSDPATIFTGERHAPAALDASETGRVDLTQTEALDCPDWLWPHLQASLADQAAPVMAALRDRAPVTLRVNTRRSTMTEVLAVLSADGIEAVEVPAVATALRVETGARKVQNAAAYGQGLVELQDAASQAAVALVPLREGQSLLDYCAGGGGKGLAFAARGAKVTAHDIDPRRMADIPARAARAGVRIAVCPPASLAPEQSFDVVFVDAPCTGSGTWRRTPEAKWALTQARLDALVMLQAQVLSQAAAHVRAGGILAYATCSMLDQENGRQVEAFLAANPSFAEITRQSFLPDGWGDGFFVAVMAKQA